MTHRLTRLARGMHIGGMAAAMLLAGCGGEGAGDAPSTAASAASGSDGPVANACPAEGCQITIVDAERDGDEIAITWEANFVPDLSRNHIHVYWDIYTADQVSSDAEARNVTQGEWVPTDVVPTFVTQDVVAVDQRGDSTTLCVTAADRDHAVLDASIVDCRDVADSL